MARRFFLGVRWSFLGILALSCGLMGCGGSGANSPTAANAPKFEVDDDSKTTESTTPVKADTPAETPEAPPAEAAKPKAPRKVFALPKGDSQAQWKFIEQMQQQLDATQPDGNSPEEILATLEPMMKAVIAASERILNDDGAGDLRVKAAYSKQAALMTLAGGNSAYQSQLKDYLEKLADDKDASVAELGVVAKFESKFQELIDGENWDPKPVVAEIRKMLERASNSRSIYSSARAAAVAIDNAGHHEDAVALYKLLGEKYAAATDEEIKDDLLNVKDMAKMAASGFLSKFNAFQQGKEGALDDMVDSMVKVIAEPDRGILLLKSCLSLAEDLERADRYAAASKVYEAIGKHYADHENKDLAQAVTRQTEYAAHRTALVGKPLSIEAVTLADGKPFDWAKYKGKVVLVDFWATWCGPCLREIPHLKTYLEALQEKGFEIVGVNLDVNVDRRTSFLAKNQLPWETIVKAEIEPNLENFDHPWFAECGILGIPFMLLLDKEGNVAALETRGEKFERKVAELLGLKSDAPTDPGKDEEKPAPKAPAKADEKEPQPDAKPEAKEGASLDLNLGTQFVAFFADEKPAEKPADAPAEVNPYAAPEGLSTAQLVDYLLNMQEKPRSIQLRPGFADAVSEAADRVLAAEAKDRFHILAAQAKIEALHRSASLGDEAADKKLRAFTEKMKDDKRPAIAAEIKFLEMERKVVDADTMAVEKVPELLAEIKTYLKDETLTARHLRLASSTVHAINRITDDDKREEYFQEFGALFAKSKDKQLARYGKKLMAEEGDTQLVGKEIELAGETVAGDKFDWQKYRGKVVLVDFWATWCGPCRREIPNVKNVLTKFKDKGFDVVGVNVDQDPEAVTEFFQDNQLPWSNLTGDGAQEAAKKCGVRALPTMLLIGRDGKVVAAGHHVADFDGKIEKLLAK